MTTKEAIEKLKEESRKRLEIMLGNVKYEIGYDIADYDDLSKEYREFIPMPIRNLFNVLNMADFDVHNEEAMRYFLGTNEDSAVLDWFEFFIYDKNLKYNSSFLLEDLKATFCDIIDEDNYSGYKSDYTSFITAMTAGDIPENIKSAYNVEDLKESVFAKAKRRFDER